MDSQSIRITLSYKIILNNGSAFVLTARETGCIIVLPYMASLIAKKKANQLYYYVVESARVDGKPRIVHQTYLGTAEKVAALVKDRTAPLPLSATALDFGLPGALWLAAQTSGVFASCSSRSGPSPAPALRRRTICCWPPSTASASPDRRPKSPTGIDRTILRSLWGFPAGAVYLAGLLGLLRSDSGPARQEDELEQAQIAPARRCGRKSNW